MTQHASLEDLLALRDELEPANPESREHTENCSVCRGELDRLKQLRADLAALSSPTPPRDLWLQVAPKSQSPARWRNARRLLLAASIVGALALATLVPRESSKPSGLVERDALASALIDAQELSQHLEVEMETLRLSDRALRGWQAAAIVDLEDELEVLDERLSSVRESPTAQLEIWQQKLMLQDALFRVHVDPGGLRNL